MSAVYENLFFSGHSPVRSHWESAADTHMNREAGNGMGRRRQQKI